MALLGESQLSFELIEALLNYIKSLKIPGGVLIFMPGSRSPFSITLAFFSEVFFVQQDFGLLKARLLIMQLPTP